MIDGSFGPTVGWGWWERVAVWGAVGPEAGGIAPIQSLSLRGKLDAGGLGYARIAGSRLYPAFQGRDVGRCEFFSRRHLEILFTVADRAKEQALVWVAWN
jgi:hypothetical protein